MAPPRSENAMRGELKFRLSDVQVQRLDELTKVTGLSSRSEVLRQIIDGKFPLFMPAVSAQQKSNARSVAPQT